MTTIRRWSLRLTVSFWLGLNAAPALGQIAPGDIDQAQREIDRIQQEQRERRERERQERIESQPRTVLELPVPTPNPSAEAGVCRDINQIDVTGAVLMKSADHYEITKEFVGKCLALPDIEGLLTRITNFYIDRGRIGARAYIQTQDLNAGVLNVVVVEGKLESLQLDDAGKGSINLTGAFPGVVGAPLNLRDFEQGLDQINRLSSNKATMDLKPGVEPGGSVVVVRNTASRWFHANLTYDNYGGDSTGRNQAGVTALIDNALGINDGAILTHRRTTGDDFGAQHSRTTSLLYSVPVGYFTITASQVFSDYASTIQLPTIALVADGDTVISSLQFDYVAYRDRVNRLTLSSTITVNDTENFIAGEKLATSSRTQSSIDFNAAWGTQLLGGSLNARIGAAHGVPIFGGEDDPASLPFDAPTAEFLKWTTGLSWSRPFQIGAQPLVYGASFNGQWSDDALYGSEQFSIGSIFTVRGYRGNSLAGARGYYLRNELSLPMSYAISSAGVSVRPYIGADIGRIEKQFDQPGGTLSGASAGLTLSAFGITLDVQCTTPIEQPKSFVDQGSQWFANFTFTL